MTPYDVAMLGVLVAGMVWGALRGITWQLASIASLVLGYAVAFPLSAELAPRFPGEPVVARGLALLVAYAGVSGGVFLAAWLVRATLRRWKFEAFDRHLGMLLGGAEGVLLGVVATVIVLSVAPQSHGGGSPLHPQRWPTMARQRTDGGKAVSTRAGLAVGSRLIRSQEARR